jgi:hypothetical protein
MKITRFVALIMVTAVTHWAAEAVDFSYAFAPPHRMTVGQPGASEKTLLDLEPAALTLAWTDGDLRAVPLGVWQAPKVNWRVKLQPLIDGTPVTESEWRRAPSAAPQLVNRYRRGSVELSIDAVGGKEAAILRVRVRNGDQQPHRVALRAEVQGGWVAHNPGWISPEVDAGVLTAMQFDRADRLLLCAMGAVAKPPGPKALALEWSLAPGEERTGWLMRPYRAYASDLAAWRGRDLAAEFRAAGDEWDRLWARTASFELPDPDVARGFRAAWADLFIMREPLAGGYTGTICGTEIYRSTNPFEPALAAIALDQLGLSAEALEGLRVHLEMQEPDGNWSDPYGWAHHMWGAAGMKAWAALEHYRLTRDRAFLARVYPRLLANSRWQRAQRAAAGTGGLMPRGMGDGGLMNGADYFGVFRPHNYLAVLADRLAWEAAKELGHAEEGRELEQNFHAAWAALQAAVAAGPDRNTGSAWGLLFPVFPTRLVDPGDPTVTALLQRMEKNLSPGGHPVHTGWMADGIWAAITLDNLAEVHLLRDEGDAAAAYLYATLNHASPLFTWCEERGQEPGSAKVSGDRQHLWTPLAVVRYVRDALVMEQAGTLHLARGTARSWLAPGRTLGVTGAPTHFGAVSYRLVAGEHEVQASGETPAPTVLHLRRAGPHRITRVTLNDRDWPHFDAAAGTVALEPGRFALRIQLGP